MDSECVWVRLVADPYEEAEEADDLKSRAIHTQSHPYLGLCHTLRIRLAAAEVTDLDQWERDVACNLRMLVLAKDVANRLLLTNSTNTN